MIELHPAIVHFPIALLTVAAFFGLLSLFTKKELFREIAFWNLLLGVIGSIAAVLTGFIGEQNLAHNDEIHQVLTKHKFTGLGILILSFALLTWIWVRKNKFGKVEYITWVLFLVLGTAAVFYQGFLGGKMVFEQGAGVKPMEQYMGHGDSTKPHSHSNSTENQGQSNQAHDHENANDAGSQNNEMQEKTQHDHSSAGQDSVIKQDTSKKQKEKKKELKDMKY